MQVQAGWVGAAAAPYSIRGRGNMCMWAACRQGKRRTVIFDWIALLHDLYIENLDVFFRFFLVDSGVLDLVDNI